MKSISFLILAIVTCVASMGRACEFTINGKSVPSLTLHQGQGAPLNEGTNNSTVLVTCEPFKGTVEGFNRTERLKPGVCTIISNSGALTLLECEQAGAAQASAQSQQVFTGTDLMISGLFACPHSATFDDAKADALKHAVQAGFKVENCHELNRTYAGGNGFCGTSSTEVNLVCDK